LLIAHDAGTHFDAGPVMLNRLAGRAKLLSFLRDHFRSYGLALLVFFLACERATAQADLGIDRNAQNLMVVLRESIGGANKQDETLQPMGGMRAKLSDGREVDVESAAFLLLGDMHVRFVFDGPSYMPNAKPQDLTRFGMNPEQALRLAIGNIKRVYGNPVVKPFAAGLMQVQGRSPDFNSSYFLDREFWRSLLKQHPEGILAAVPKRGGLVFTPVSNVEAVNGLRKGIGYLYSSSGSMRVSSALYLFKDDRWTVFQPPQPQ
jgi:hypothetical protein